MKLKCSFFRNIIFIIAIIFIVYSCSDENSPIGLNILPNSDKFEFKSDTIKVECFTIRDSKITTDERSLSPLGSYFDPEFGFTKASFACHLRLSASNVDFSNVQKINGMELRLRYKYHYGDSSTNQTVRVFRIKKNIYIDSVYYENFTFSDSELEFLAEAPLVVNSADTLVKIQMPQSLIEEFISTSNKTNFADNDKFLSFFKGIYVTTENVSSSGAIYVFDLISTKSQMVFKYNDSLSFNFLINSKSAIINMFEHDYSSASARIQNVLQDTTVNNQYCFVQSLGGLKVKLKFPQLIEKFQNGIFGINKAQLVLNIDVSTVDTKFPPPPKLTLVRIKKDGGYDFLTDYKINNASFGGDLNQTTYQYVFNIPFHIQELVNGSSDNGLYLFATDNRTYPYRCVLHNGEDDFKAVSLRIFYSIF